MNPCGIDPSLVSYAFPLPFSYEVLDLSTAFSVTSCERLSVPFGHFCSPVLVVVQFPIVWL